MERRSAVRRTLSDLSTRLFFLAVPAHLFGLLYVDVVQKQCEGREDSKSKGMETLTTVTQEQEALRECLGVIQQVSPSGSSASCRKARSG